MSISIPRDSYVQVPGIGMSKINAAYGATKANRRTELIEADTDTSEAELEAESTQAGREALIESVADLTGVTVDHYAEVGLLGFVLLYQSGRQPRISRSEVLAKSEIIEQYINVGEWCWLHGEDAIRSKTFIRCFIDGPGVMYFGPGASMEGS